MSAMQAAGVVSERDLIRKLEHLTGKTVTLQPGPGE
jgi:hypothetical protein